MFSAVTSKTGLSPLDRTRLSMKPLQTLKENKPLLGSDEVIFLMLLTIYQYKQVTLQ